MNLKQKAKGLIGSGRVLNALNAFNQPMQPQYIPTPDPTPVKKTLSTEVKVAIGVGSAFLLGILIYALSRKKGKK